MSGVTLRDPVTFGAQFARLRNFTIDDITFDYKHWNPAPNNMDGVHFDGGCQFGRISNLKGTCYDDLLALNANDAMFDSPFQGPISDIEVDGIFSEGCHAAVRMLSACKEAPLQRINIRNVYGTYYRYIIGFTHFGLSSERGRFEDIVLENLFVRKTFLPEAGFNRPVNRSPIFIEQKTDVSFLTIRNMHRAEENIPIATIEIEENACVDNLVLRDCSNRNSLKESFDFLYNNGSIDKLVMHDVRLYGPPASLISGNGTIKEKNVTDCWSEQL